MTHIDELLSHVPDLFSRKMLDLGAGRGKFLFALAERNVSATGLEPSAQYVEIIKARAKTEGKNINIVQGVAEAMPFPDSSFGFANVSEVVEHVTDPQVLLDELFRILEKGGYAYVSIPNRYGFKDPHFHLYLVNWMPRFMSDWFIGLFGKHKDYTNLHAGVQRLADMHYMTHREALIFFQESGFLAEDIRMKKIDKRFTSPLLRPFVKMVYLPLRFCYFDSLHFLVQKPVA